MPGAEFECRVYFEDTDAGGVVYNANYMKFYERARTEFLRGLGYEQDELLAQNIVFVVRKMDLDFLQAARFNDILKVVTSVEKLKNASVVFNQEIFGHVAGQKPSDERKLINKAQVLVVCVQADNFKPTAIPSEIHRKLKPNE